MRSAILSLLIILLVGCQDRARPYSAMTYNIRYANEGDGVNKWDLRKQWLAGQVLFHEPDFLGIQEGLERQVTFLDSVLAHYSYVGVGRDDGKARGEFSALFFRSDLFSVVESGTFWLSPTPSEVSVGWDAAMERICTYALLKENETGTEIWVFNTHFDHIGEKARSNSARLIVSEIEKRQEGRPVILMGDLNLPPESEPITYLTSRFTDSYPLAKVKTGPHGTFNGFRTDQPAVNRIDYIFVSPGIAVNKYACFADPVDLRYPSDHFPVLIKFYLE